MENYEKTGKKAPLSDSDRGYRISRASKLTGYSHDSLSKLCQNLTTFLWKAIKDNLCQNLTQVIKD